MTTDLALLQSTIDVAWERRADINAANAPDVLAAVEQVISALNGGRLRVAHRRGDQHPSARQQSVLHFAPPPPSRSNVHPRPS